MEPGKAVHSADGRGGLWRFVRYLQWTWCVVGISFAILLALNGVTSVYYSRTGSSESRHRADVYEGASQPQEYFDEFDRAGNAEWRPYVYWRRAAFRGKLINVNDNGLRVTLNDQACSEGQKRAKVFLFGGSTMWGSGARDEHTIPSLLSRFVGERGLSGVCVTNFGETGYVNTQSVITLLLELRKGNIPDVVVFYDGINDTFSAFQNGTAGIPQNESNRRLEFNLSKSPLRMLAAVVTESSLYRLAQGIRRRLPGGRSPAVSRDSRRTDDLATKIADAYWGNVALVQRLAEGYRFSPLFYWQPLVFDKHPLSPFEERQSKVGEVLLPTSFHRLVRMKIVSHKDRQAYAFHDLSKIFRDTREPMFIDFAHLGEAGNERIARRMSADVIGTLSKTTSGGPSTSR